MRRLHTKLALSLAAAFIVVVALLAMATHAMFDPQRRLELALFMLLAGVSFALLTVLCVYQLFTRRLERVTRAIKAFAEGGCTTPLRLHAAAHDGDEIDHLSTHVERMSERSVQQLEELQRTDASRRELLANVSHDLRTPLASIQGYLEMLLLKHGSLPPQEERSYLEIATRHSERLSKLIRDLFQLTKLEAHELKMNDEVFSVAELAQDVVQKFQLAAESRGLQLGCGLIGPQVQVRADIPMIETVLENLIENALRHTPRGGRIQVEVEQLSARMVVRIADTGCGIPKEDMARLFERYYHVDRGGSGVAAGTGLGLAIARRIVELHGGTIRVDSKPGQGTTFGFDLPVAAIAGAVPRTLALDARSQP